MSLREQHDVVGEAEVGEESSIDVDAFVVPIHSSEDVLQGGVEEKRRDGVSLAYPSGDLDVHSVVAVDSHLGLGVGVDVAEEVDEAAWDSLVLQRVPE